ncbi:hypothetical protein LPU83_pLPU83d_0630 (plasmid) [Rhizobium favelukesii]|uniref:Uncharacterized protein n=1 Tax=Rhizobium favelukesii TaxID=348824 RepID=W6S743_9HYPH|nr:hypothetical protein LPU83_pLPU83d_0630 [Rhizobium favelukesii]
MLDLDAVRIARGFSLKCTTSRRGRRNPET